MLDDLRYLDCLLSKFQGCARQRFGLGDQRHRRRPSDWRRAVPGRDQPRCQQSRFCCTQLPLGRSRVIREVMTNTLWTQSQHPKFIKVHQKRGSLGEAGRKSPKLQFPRHWEPDAPRHPTNLSDVGYADVCGIGEKVTWYDLVPYWFLMIFDDHVPWLMICWPRMV